MSGKVHAITDANFDAEVLKSETPVFVDFWATWCPPCKIVAPILDELAEEMDGKLKVCKVNVDENQRTAQTYQTMSIPTLLIFKNGKLVDRILGALPKQMIEQKLQVHLNSGD